MKGLMKMSRMSETPEGVLETYDWQDVAEDLQERIDKAIEILKKHKADLDYEPWSIYQVRGSILFDLANVLESKNGKERNTKTDS